MAKKPTPRGPATPNKAPSKRVLAPTRVIPARSDIFISYSHKDKEWLEQVHLHLKPLEDNHKVVVWQDRKLRGGALWEQEIKQALARTRIAILLVSPNFLGSDFIRTNELPPLLKSAKRGGTLILPVLLSSCAFPHSALAAFQVINSLDQPLDLLTKGQVNQVLAQLHDRVLSEFETPRKSNRVVRTSARATNVIAESSRIPIFSSKKSRQLAVPKLEAKDSSAAMSRAKVNRAKTTPREAKPATSKLALLVTQQGDWEAIPVSKSAVGTELLLHLRPTQPEQRAFLATLRQRTDLSSVVVGAQTYQCRQISLTTVTEGSTESWHLQAAYQVPGARTEITYNGISPTVQAEARASLLLLDERPVDDHRTSLWNLNSGMTEVSGSPLPQLYQHLNRQTARFNQLAPLVAAWFLQFSNTVEHILRLEIELKNGQLTVRFSGKQPVQYHAQPASIIKVEGKTKLGTPSEKGPLRLGPLRRW